MRRETLAPRPDWPARCEALGFRFHHVDGQPYWNEAACYRFTAAEIDALEEAADALHGLCLEALDWAVENDRLAPFGIPAEWHGAVKASWRAREPSLYGRFDLCFDGGGPPKLLEYNAETPTALMEAAVVQWQWLEEVAPAADQFNFIHEALVDAWRAIPAGGPVHLACLRGSAEDAGTIEYMADAAAQAGHETRLLYVDEIGWQAAAGRFVDREDRPIGTLFRLYPGEMMLADEGAANLATAGIRLIEPLWKLPLSSKGLLSLLWHLFPDHPNLLPAFHDPAPLGGSFVAKPLYGREGANLTMVQDGRTVLETPGPYGGGGFVFQALQPLPVFEGRHALVGAWIVGGKACGIGMREDSGPITSNSSRFVPHLFE
ncbi:MAG: glutathionylspermidine synthase family protein [Thalassobaculales bacterium]